MKNPLLLLLAVLPAAAMAAAPITLAPMFRDHAVLQRYVPVPIWGTAEPGATVAIRLVRADEAAAKPCEKTEPGVGDYEMNCKVAPPDPPIFATVDADGRWKATLPASSRSWPGSATFTLRVGYAPAGEAGAPIALGDASAPSGAGAVAEDILFGDVWLCSGQSNMDMNYGWGLTRGKEDIETNVHATIRLFDDRNRTALSPQRDLPDDYGWTPCDPAHAKRFSAVGYFFGQALQEAMPDVPIGLVEASWSGSPIKTWIPYEAAEAVGGDFGKQAAERRAIAEAWENGGREQFKVDLAAWMDKLPAIDPGDDPAAPDFDDSDWQTANLPEITEKHVSPDFDGWVWYRKTVVIDESTPVEILDVDNTPFKPTTTLALGPIDDQDWTYVNGVLVGSTNAWDAPRTYAFDPSLFHGVTLRIGVVHEGTNTIAVKILDWGGHSGMWTRKAEELFLRREWEDRYSFTGREGHKIESEGRFAQSIPLAGEWKFKAFPAEPRPVDPSSPSSWDIAGCHNGMVAPLFGMAAKGAIWYQGCSDVGSADLYAKQFPAMVGAWREGFVHDDAGFPVYLVQLAAFKETHAEPIDSAWARMRWTQMQLGETVPHCGTAVAIDVGDHRDIHPKDKKTVGERLARLALARTYGATDLAESGPVPKAVKVRRVSPDAPVEFDTVFVNYLEDTLVVEFDNEKGLSTSDGKEVRGFQVTDGQFTVPVDATIEIRGGRSVVVLDHDDLSLLSWTPTAVRYAWDDYPDCNLVNGAGLPCGPFELEIEP